MRVDVILGPHAGKTLDMASRQAESAIKGGWAKPAADGTPTALPAGSAVVPFDVLEFVKGLESKKSEAGE